MKNRIGLAAVLLFLLALVYPPSQAHAGATLFISNPTCSNFTSPNPSPCGNYLYPPSSPTEAESIPSNALGILQNSGGASASVNPLLLILGVPNTGSDYSAPAITLSSGTGAIGHVDSFGAVFGGSWNTSTGFAGDFTAAFKNKKGPSDVYSFMGLQGPTNGSNSFVNWAGADSAVNSITATEFGIYVYELENTDINTSGGKQTVTVNFASSLDKGTFAVAYSQDGFALGTIFDTPFTEAGLTTSGKTPPPPPQVPEPGTMALLGMGLAFAGAFSLVRRKWADS